MLPQLLNITTGTSVRGDVFVSRASSQPPRPEPVISSAPPSSKVPCSAK